MNKKLFLINLLVVTLLVIVVVRENYPQRLYNRITGDSEKEERAIKQQERNTQETVKYNTWLSLFKLYSKVECKIAFVGDSHTCRINWNELLNRNDVINRGVGSQTTKNILKLNNYAIEAKPEYIFVMAGINDVINGIVVDSICRNYTVIIETIQQGEITPVIQSTLFVSDSVANYKSINLTVDSLNTFLKTFAKKENIDFLDINTSLIKNGALNKQYTYEGLHLNGEGYLIWKNILVPFLEEGDI